MFVYSQSAVFSLTETITHDRLDSYIKAANGDLAEALRLYVQNSSVSESFYTPLQGVEVAVRNSMHAQLAKGFGVDWYDNSSCKLQYKQRSTVDHAKVTLLSGAKPVTPGRVVAELSFGFWTGLLGPKYETTLWRGHLRHAFPQAPSPLLRKQAHGALDRIRKLRNRIMHHEPILRRNLVEDHDLILQVTEWICPQTRAWVAHHSRFPGVLAGLSGASSTP